MNRDRFKFYMDELDLVDEQTRRQIGILACCEGLMFGDIRSRSG